MPIILHTAANRKILIWDTMNRVTSARSIVKASQNRNLGFTDLGVYIVFRCEL
jgi:hypothetical protein